MISLKLTESTQIISAKINSSISTELNNRLKNAKGKILRKCEPLVNQWIVNSPEIQSLSSANPMSLAGLFGIPASQQNSISSIVSNSVSKSTKVVIDSFDKNLTSGGISVFFQPSSFTNLLGLSVGHVIDTGLDLHWMKWLLQFGDRTIITKYSYDPSTGRGRSGHGTMTIGGSFKVPSAFSGDENNNFITRALTGKNQVNAIFQILKDIL